MELANKTLGKNSSRPFQGHYFLVLIDAHSKWIEAFPATSPSSTVTIELLRPVFAQFGTPETVVSDNGSYFVSEDFQLFLKANGIKQITSAPYHPSTNSLAEKAVQIVKKGLKKIIDGLIKSRLARILLAYRTTLHSTTGNTPAKLLLGRNLRTRLDLLKPNTAEHNSGARRFHMTIPFNLTHLQMVNQS